MLEFQHDFRKEEARSAEPFDARQGNVLLAIIIAAVVVCLVAGGIWYYVVTRESRPAVILQTTDVRTLGAQIQPLPIEVGPKITMTTYTKSPTGYSIVQSYDSVKSFADNFKIFSDYFRGVPWQVVTSTNNGNVAFVVGRVRNLTVSVTLTSGPTTRVSMDTEAAL